MNSKLKLAGLGAIAAIAAASPFVLKLETPNAIAAAPASAGFSSSQKTELEGIIKAYILEHTEVLMESVNNYRSTEEKRQNDQAAQALKDNSDAFLKSAHLPDVGNKNADVTIVEFFDYNCGYCKQGFEAVQQGLNEDKNLRFVFIDLPILSESSTTASRFALAAQKQNKYFELHRALMTFNGPKTEESILKLAKDAGLDVEKLKADEKSPDVDEAIKKNQELAQKLAINGTPAFIVGEELIRGYIPYPAMKTLIEKQRADKKKG